MPSAYDIYVFYLEPDDLRGQSHAVKVLNCKLEPVFDPLTKRDINKLVLYFEAKKKTLPLNKTQVSKMIEISGTDDYTKWAGTQITITPATAPNKKQTIAITPSKIEKS